MKLSVWHYTNVIIIIIIPTDDSRTDLYVLLVCYFDTHALIYQTTDRRPVKSIPQVRS